MHDEARAWTEPDLELRDPMIVVGVPTLGLVGSIVSNYLVETLEMDPVGGIRSPYFPPVGHAHGGRLQRPFGIHAIETSCGIERRCEHLVVVGSPFLPIPPIQNAVAETLVSWAADQEANWIVVPDGLMVSHDESALVHGVASSDHGLDRLGELGLDPVDEGVIGGMSSLLLFEGEEQGVDTVSILAESAQDHPDARAAARLVEVLDKIVPDISIEAEPLRKEAERIEEAVRESRSRLEAQAEEMQGPGPESMMFG